MLINKVTYETKHISLLDNSMLPKILSFCFYLCYCNQKGKYQIRRKTNRKNEYVIREINFIIVILIY